MRKRSRAAAAAFTLVELLVALVVILILVSITIPVVSRMRQTAYSTNSAALIQALDSAIQQYRQVYGAYPGPLSNEMLGPSPSVAHGISNLTGATQRITGSENLALGLLGGLTLQSGTVVYDWEAVGQGPRSLNPLKPARQEPLLESRDLSWTDGQGGANEPGPTSGRFADAIASANDSDIPEFVDRFPNPLPILYLRARVGANATPNNVIMAGGTAQYDINQIIGYTDPTGTYSSGNTVPPTGASIGVGKDLDAYYQGSGNNPIDPKNASGSWVPYHGLRTIDPNRQMTQPTQSNYYIPADAYPYFENPSIPGSPRQKDAYILISAGKDRVYGTADDVTNFGPVMPQR